MYVSVVRAAHDWCTPKDVIKADLRRFWRSISYFIKIG